MRRFPLATLALPRVLAAAVAARSGSCRAEEIAAAVVVTVRCNAVIKDRQSSFVSRYEGLRCTTTQMILCDTPPEATEAGTYFCPSR